MHVRITTCPTPQSDGVPGNNVLSTLPWYYCWCPACEPPPHQGISRCRPTFSFEVCIWGVHSGWTVGCLHNTLLSETSCLIQRATQKPSWRAWVTTETSEKHTSICICWQCRELMLVCTLPFTWRKSRRQKFRRENQSKGSQLLTLPNDACLHKGIQHGAPLNSKSPWGKFTMDKTLIYKHLCSHTSVPWNKVHRHRCVCAVRY